MDHTTLASIVCPISVKDPSWFESTPDDARTEFVREHCSKVYSCDGQACVIVSYPRQTKDASEFNVAVYDIDAARITWAPLSMLRLGCIFEEVYRDSEEADFEFDAICSSSIACEAFDIAARLFG